MFCFRRTFFDLPTSGKFFPNPFWHSFPFMFHFLFFFLLSISFRFPVFMTIDLESDQFCPFFFCPVGDAYIRALASIRNPSGEFRASSQDLPFPFRILTFPFWFLVFRQSRGLDKDEVSLPVGFRNHLSVSCSNCSSRHLSSNDGILSPPHLFTPDQLI